MTRPNKPDMTRIRDEAADWVIRLADQPDDRDRADFKAWLTASPAHEQAFRREQQVWQQLNRLSQLRPANGAPDADLLAPLSARREQRAAAKPWRPLERWRTLAAGVLLLLGAAAAATVTLTATQAYATGVGEHRLVVLADGSTVNLNTDSRIVVHYWLGGRSVRLVRGEAVFHIAHGPRAFVVSTPETQLKADVADLSVRITDEAARVTVIDGAASATMADAPATAMTPGTNLVVDETGTQVHQVSSDDVNHMLAWRQGSIFLSGQTLTEAANEFNRYNTRKIIIADPVAGTVRVGGVFGTSDLDGFATAVARTFPVTVSRGSEDQVVIASRTQASGK